MKILAIDTSGQSASAAIYADEKILAEIFVDCGLTHSQTIMPMVEEIFKKTSVSPSEIDYIACVSGPGSFTGLRIGASTAKGLAFALNKKIIPVPALDALAYNIINNNENTVILPLMDARRGQAYTAFYGWENEKFIKTYDYSCQNIVEIIDELRLRNASVCVLGDGAAVFRETLLSSGISCVFAPPHLNRVHASAVAVLAVKRVDEAVACDEFELFYVRKPQAEREREL